MKLHNNEASESDNSAQYNKSTSLIGVLEDTTVALAPTNETVEYCKYTPGINVYRNSTYYC